jgi:hypothetical protein
MLPLRPLPAALFSWAALQGSIDLDRIAIWDRACFAFFGRPVSEVLKEETRTTGRSRGRLSLTNTLLAGQVAASLVLLVVAGMFLRTIQHEYTIDPGYQTKHLALFMLYPGQAGYDQKRTEQFYKQAREHVSGVPGVASISWASNLPLWGRKQTGVVIEGQEQRKKSEAISAVVNTIHLDYFSTLGIGVCGRAGLHRR